MKKILFSVALMGLFLTAGAKGVEYSTDTTSVATGISQQVQVKDEFKDIKLEGLSPKVQAVVKGFTTEYNLKSLAYNAAKKQTKVTLVPKAGGNEKVVLLDEEGKEI